MFLGSWSRLDSWPQVLRKSGREEASEEPVCLSAPKGDSPSAIWSACLPTGNQPLRNLQRHATLPLHPDFRVQSADKDAI